MSAHEVLTTVRTKVAGIEFAVRDVPAEQVEDRTYTTGEVTERVWLLIAHELAKLGITDGIAFKFMRKSVKLTAVQLAEAFDVSPTTVSNWETGETTVPRAVWAVVANVIAEQLGHHDTAMSHLKAAQHPRRPKGVVELANA